MRGVIVVACAAWIGCGSPPTFGSGTLTDGMPIMMVVFLSPLTLARTSDTDPVLYTGWAVAFTTDEPPGSPCKISIQTLASIEMLTSQRESASSGIVLPPTIPIVAVEPRPITDPVALVSLGAGQTIQSGVVTITSFDHNRVVGTFDVTTTRALHASGAFDANDCFDDSMGW